MENPQDVERQIAPPWPGVFLEQTNPLYGRLKRDEKIPVPLQDHGSSLNRHTLCAVEHIMQMLQATVYRIQRMEDHCKCRAPKVPNPKLRRLELSLNGSWPKLRTQGKTRGQLARRTTPEAPADPYAVLRHAHEGMQLILATLDIIVERLQTLDPIDNDVLKPTNGGTAKGKLEDSLTSK